MNKRPFSVRVVFVLIALDALLWLALGLIIAVDAHPPCPSKQTSKPFKERTWYLHQIAP